MPIKTIERTCENLIGDTCSPAPPEPTESLVELFEPLDENGLIHDTGTFPPTLLKSVTGVTHLVSFLTPSKNIKKTTIVDACVNAKAKNAVKKPLFGMWKMRIC